MKKMIPCILTLFCAGLIISCASSPLHYPLLQREWMLVSFGTYTRQQLVSDGAKIDLKTPVQDGKIQGVAFMGCNRMFFSSGFKKNGTLKISGLGSTMMACTGMKLEEDFAKSFKNMTRYTVSGHFLFLNDGQGAVMKFVASDWD